MNKLLKCYQNNIKMNKILKYYQKLYEHKKETQCIIDSEKLFNIKLKRL